MLIDTWHLQVSKTVFKVWENSEPLRLLKELWVNAKYNNHFHSECKHYNHSLKFDSEVRFLERGDEVMSSECVRIYAVSQSFFTFFLPHYNLYWAVQCSCHYRGPWHYSKVAVFFCCCCFVVLKKYFPSRPVFSWFEYIRESKNCSSSCSLCTSITAHITPIFGEPHWLPADARISSICMTLFQRHHLFHSCLSFWSPATVLSFLITSLLYRHWPPATPTL